MNVNMDPAPHIELIHKSVTSHFAFCLVRRFKLYSLRKFQLCNTLLTIVYFCFHYIYKISWLMPL